MNNFQSTSAVYFLPSTGKAEEINLKFKIISQKMDRRKTPHHYTHQQTNLASIKSQEIGQSTKTDE